jgi:hypothetical protein
LGAARKPRDQQKHSREIREVKRDQMEDRTQHQSSEREREMRKEGEREK